MEKVELISLSQIEQEVVFVALEILVATIDKNLFKMTDKQKEEIAVYRDIASGIANDLGS